MVLRAFANVPVYLWGTLRPTQLRLADLAFLAVGTLVWVAVAKWVLEKAGSALPAVVMKRLGRR
jgi:hypothetical protein